jgi:hypothetical protein
VEERVEGVVAVAGDEVARERQEERPPVVAHDGRAALLIALAAFAGDADGHEPAATEVEHEGVDRIVRVCTTARPDRRRVE